MYLRDLSLDLGYIVDEERVKATMQDNCCTLSEAMSILYQDIWKVKGYQFRLQTRCISSMFERLLGRLKTATEDCWKILVNCIEDAEADRMLMPTDVCSVQVKYAYKDFAARDSYQKKQQALRLLMRGIEIVAKAKGWDITPFKAVEAQIIEADYRNEWVLWKKSSPNKKLIAELLLQHEVSQIDISIVVHDRKGTELIREKIVTELPHEFVFIKHLGKLTWLSNSEVALVNRLGDNTWVVSIDRI